MAFARADVTSSEVAELLAMARRKLSEGQPSLALQAVVAALRAQGGEGAVVAALHRARTAYHNGIDNSPETDELAALFAQCALAEVRSSDHFLQGQGSGSPTATVMNGHLPEHGDSAAFRREDDMELCSAFQQSAPPSSMPQDVQFAEFRARYGGPLGNSGSNIASDREEETMPCSQIPILAENGRMQLMVDAAADGSSFLCPRCQGLVKLQRRDEHFQYWCSGS